MVPSGYWILVSCFPYCPACQQTAEFNYGGVINALFYLTTFTFESAESWRLRTLKTKDVDDQTNIPWLLVVVALE